MEVPRRMVVSVSSSITLSCKLSPVLAVISGPGKVPSATTVLRGEIRFDRTSNSWKPHDLVKPSGDKLVLTMCRSLETTSPRTAYWERRTLSATKVVKRPMAIEVDGSRLCSKMNRWPGKLWYLDHSAFYVPKDLPVWAESMRRWMNKAGHESIMRFKRALSEANMRRWQDPSKPMEWVNMMGKRQII